MRPSRVFPVLAVLLPFLAPAARAGDDAPDLATLSPQAKAEVERVYQDEFCGCGAPHTLGQCVKTHADCHHSRRLAKLAVLEAGRGVTAAEIGVELGKYEQGFRDGRRTFSPDARQCTGKPGAPVTLVEFSDFQCPHCALARPILEKFVADSGGRVRLCWQAFPLTQHPQAMPAAMAALFARDKGKFWAVHDALFENQTRLDANVITDLVQKAGLSGAEWKKVAEKESYRVPAEEQRAVGVGAGVDSTPTVFLNGRKLELPLTPDVLSVAVEDELEWQRTQGTWVSAAK